MLQTVFNVLKVSAIVAVSAVFMIAITTLLNMINQLVFGGVITETIQLVSMYLPFDASAVFGSISTVLVGILSFMIAKKIFDLTSWSISSV